jgi:hypothetical protein
MSSSASKPKSGPKANFTPCGSLAEKVKAKLESLHIHPLKSAIGGRKYSVTINDKEANNIVIVNIYEIDRRREGSKHTVAIDRQMTYVIFCDKRTFFTAGVSDAEVTRYLKEEHRLDDITGHPSRLGGGRRRHTKHRRHTKRRRSTRKN